ncbi:MAG: YihY/virulence factor BrkB family protein [Spirochaetia bacterium]
MQMLRLKLLALQERLPWRVQRFVVFWRAVVRRYKADRGALLAKGLAFSFVWGTVPLLFGVFLLRLDSPLTPRVRASVSEQVLGFLPPDMRYDLLLQLTRVGGGALPGVITVLALVIAVISMFDSLELAMSTMLGSRRRHAHFRKFISLGLMVGVVTLFYAAAVAAPMVRLPVELLNIIPGFTTWYAYGVTGLLFAVMFYGLLRLFARRPLRPKSTFGVCLVAAFAWQIAGRVVGVAMRAVGSRYLIYGAVAWAVIFLLFMRILADIIILASIVVGRFSPTEEEEILRLLESNKEAAPHQLPWRVVRNE